MFLDYFFKYVGIQGVVALLFGIGYVIMTVNGTPVPEGYEKFMTVIMGFVFAIASKNGFTEVKAKNAGGGK